MWESRQRERQVPLVGANNKEGPLRSAGRSARIEKLLRGRRIGQRHAHGTGALQREVQVLLVQFDAESRIESALDHALTVNFKDARSGEAAHQGLAYPGRVGPCPEEAP